LSELLDRAASIRVKQIEYDKEQAARQLDEVNGRKAKQQYEDEAKKKSMLLGSERIKEFVDLMLKHNVPCDSLYSVTSSRPNRWYLRGLRSSPNYRTQTFFDYGVYGRGWVIRDPGNRHDRDDTWWEHGLMIMSNMTLCEWEIEGLQSGRDRSSNPYDRESWSRSGLEKGEKKVLVGSILEPSYLGKFESDVDLLARAVAKTGIV